MEPKEFEERLFNGQESDSESEQKSDNEWEEEQIIPDLEPKYLSDGSYNPKHPEYQNELEDHKSTFPSSYRFNDGNQSENSGEESEEIDNQDERISDSEEDDNTEFKVTTEEEIINEEIELMEQDDIPQPTSTQAWNNRRTSLMGLSINNAQVTVILMGLIISLISGASGTFISPQGIAPTNFNISTSIQICHLKDNNFYLNKLGKQKMGETMVTWTTRTKTFTLPNNIEYDIKQKISIRCENETGTTINFNREKKSNLDFKVEAIKLSAASTVRIKLLFKSGETKVLEITGKRFQTHNLQLTTLSFPKSVEINNEAALTKLTLRHQLLRTEWDLRNLKVQPLILKPSKIQQVTEEIRPGYVYEDPTIWNCNSKETTKTPRRTFRTQPAKLYDVNIFTTHPAGYFINRQLGGVGSRKYNQTETDEELINNTHVIGTLINAYEDYQKGTNNFYCKEVPVVNTETKLTYPEQFVCEDMVIESPIRKYYYFPTIKIKSTGILVVYALRDRRGNYVEAKSDTFVGMYSAKPRTNFLMIEAGLSRNLGSRIVQTPYSNGVVIAPRDYKEYICEGNNKTRRWSTLL